MLLAIAALGGADATKEMLNANIHASDTYAFFQAKNIRQTDYQIAAEQLELLAAGLPALPAEQRGKVEQLVKRYRDVPGMIGRVGTTFGEHGINIAAAAVGHVAEDSSDECAVMVVTTDQAVPREVVAGLIESEGFVEGKAVSF